MKSIKLTEMKYKKCGNEKYFLGRTSEDPPSPVRPVPRLKTVWEFGRNVVFGTDGADGVDGVGENASPS